MTDFVFPNSTETGTLDSLLLALGKKAFPDLDKESESFVSNWYAEHKKDPLSAELCKPTGRHKAQLSAMAAILKPGRNINASLQDHSWLPSEEDGDVIKSLVEFLRELIGERAA